MEIMSIISPVLIAFIYITIFSFVKEPARQTVNTLVIAAAGATYWSGGLNFWEFPLGPVMIFLAYKGLRNYNYLGIGWLVHTGYDILHHLYGNPIVPMVSDSSFGCAICDPVLALWLFMGAPSIMKLIDKKFTGKTELS